jgi:hypothetical protein
MKVGTLAGSTLVVGNFDPRTASDYPFRDLATAGDGVRLLARPTRRILPVHRPVLQSLQCRRAWPRRSRHRHEPRGFPLRLRRNQASSRRRG